MSDPASARIRTFSRRTWIVGTVGVMLAAFLTMPQIAFLANGRVVVQTDDRLPGERVYPQHEDHPVELAIENGRIRGGIEGGWVTLRPQDGPVQLRLAALDGTEIPELEYISIYQSTPEIDNGSIGPESLGSLWDAGDAVYAVPTRTESRLWISVADPEWELAVEPVDATPVPGGAMTGSGNATLAYTGDALSAKFAHTGGGFLRVTVVAPVSQRDREPAVLDVDDFTTRTSWPVPGTVLFMIESSGGEWSVTTDE